MKPGADRITSLAEALSELFEKEQQATRALLSSLIESVRILKGETADRRFQRLSAQLKELEQRSEQLAEMACRDFLAKIKQEGEELQHRLAGSRAAAVLGALVQVQPPSLNPFCETLLDRLIEATGARRGFILFCFPESTEAKAIAARNFQTTDLSLEEYAFSRTLLRQVLVSGEPLLLQDAAQDPVYSKEISVRAHELKSVLIAPLKHEARIVGAIYLDNNTLPCAFDRKDGELMEPIARFSMLYLRHARLLPVIFERERRVFLDPGKASTELLGRDPKILELLARVQKISASQATVLLEGESGTGKELVARALHFRSTRRNQPFLAINCAAIPEALLESELFGHERGAFTGAVERFAGRLEQANRGTVFLDEISELPYPMQAKLLRFLQSGEFQRLGAKETFHVDIRVVAATSKDLKALTGAGRFHEALYYRLNVIPLTLPPLRERKDDIPLLVDHFVARFSGIYKRDVAVEPAVYDLLEEYPFPGNVRELENLIHRLVALAETDSIGIRDLPAEILKVTSQRIDLEKDPLRWLFQVPPRDLEDLRRREECVRKVFAEQRRRLAEQAVHAAGGNVTEAASQIGVHRITLHKMLARARGKPPEGTEQ